jgi:hypothetical protein
VTEPTVVTITVADNPMRGMPGQNDITVTVSSEPDLPMPADGSLPDPATLPLSILYATEALAHLAGITAETALIKIAQGNG